MADTSSSEQQQHPQSLVVNVDDNTKLGTDGTIDLSKLFDLQRIKIEYAAIKAGQNREFVVYPRTFHFSYIIRGEGTLRVTGKGEEKGKCQDLTKNDCLSFPPLGEILLYHITAGSEDIGIIRISDREGVERSVAVSLCLFELQSPWNIRSLMSSIDANGST
jgi:hypothetical protein